jgi:hypothetical protein
MYWIYRSSCRSQSKVRANNCAAVSTISLSSPWGSCSHCLVNNFWYKSGTRQRNSSPTLAHPLPSSRFIVFFPILSASPQTRHNSELALHVIEGTKCWFKFLSQKHKTETGNFLRTEQVGTAATAQDLHSGRRISAGTTEILTKVYHGCTKSLQGDSDIVPLSGHNLFRTNLLKFIKHSSFRRYK